MDACWEQLVEVARKGGKEEEPHFDVIKAVSDIWGVGGANHCMEERGWSELSVCGIVFCVGW